MDTQKAGKEKSRKQGTRHDRKLKTGNQNFTSKAETRRRCRKKTENKNGENLSGRNR